MPHHRSTGRFVPSTSRISGIHSARPESGEGAVQRLIVVRSDKNVIVAYAAIIT
jgi:hypothetical protein